MIESALDNVNDSRWRQTASSKKEKKEKISRPNDFTINCLALFSLFVDPWCLYNPISSLVNAFWLVVLDQPRFEVVRIGRGRGKWTKNRMKGTNRKKTKDG